MSSGINYGKIETIPKPTVKQLKFYYQTCGEQ